MSKKTSYAYLFCYSKMFFWKTSIFWRKKKMRKFFVLQNILIFSKTFVNHTIHKPYALIKMITRILDVSAWYKFTADF